MSSIKSISIQGIRNFGENADDSQLITFISPVTLILGGNGCGKTTIIECIKYALTGECPPGSDRGKNFVRDPKINNSAEILGQIKLAVRNIRNEGLCVCRTLKVGRKRGKPSFETLDSTISYIDEKGRESVSQRCADVDAILSRFMGVSKAIINNVLFCHQEDAYWPMDESKKLKEKFDAIFGISEYNRCVDRIIKMRKDKLVLLKFKEADLYLLERKKEEIENKSIKLEEYKKEIDRIDGLYNVCQENSTTLEKSINAILNDEKEVNKLEAEQNRLQMMRQNYMEQINTLNGKVTELIDEDSTYLKNELLSLTKRTTLKRNEQQGVESKLKNLIEQEASLKREYNNIEKQSYMLRQQMNQRDECHKKCTKIIESLCEKLNINITEMDLDSPTDIKDLMDNITSAVNMKQKNIEDFISEFESDEINEQAQIDSLKTDLIKLQENLLNSKKQYNEYKKELEEYNANIEGAISSVQQFELVTKNVADLEDSIQKFCETFQQDELKNKINLSKININNLEERFSKVDEQITYLNSLTQLLAEINLKEGELKSREQEITRIKRKNSHTLSLIYPRTEILYTNLKSQLQESMENINIEIKEGNEKLVRLKFQEQELEIKRVMLKEEITKDKSEIEKCMEFIYKECHSMPYEELLHKSQISLNNIQMELTAQQSADIYCKKYIQQIDSSSIQPYCPLCRKDLHNNEATKLKSELREQMDHLPGNITRLQAALKTEQSKYSNLLRLHPIIEQKADLEMKLPAKEKNYQDLQKHIADVCIEYESTQLLLSEPTLKQEYINSIMPDIILLEEGMKEIASLRSNIDELMTQLPSDINYGTSVISDLQIEKSTISVNLADAKRLLELDIEMYERHATTLNKMREQRNELKDKQMKLQNGVTNLPIMRERQATLKELLSKFNEEIMATVEKEEPIKSKLNKCIGRKERLKVAYQAKLGMMKSAFNDIKLLHWDCSKLYEEISNYDKQKLPQKLLEINVQIKVIDTEISEYRSNIIASKNELDEIKHLIANHQSIERNLQDNLELKLLKNKLEDLEKSYSKLENELHKFDLNNFKSKKMKLNEEKQKLTVRLGELQGQKCEINRHIVQIENELAEQSVADVLMEYKRLNCYVMLMRKACRDLLRYRLALDNSLMLYHKEKMQEINRLIREYWRLIYIGNDIDYIEIQTDVEDTNEVKKNIERRRSYNYRLVQSKNSSVIEMRGRCSAGQRVIASLIIRMALAEIFSINCGVIALDEPTTNLDQNNIISLCDALKRTVEERKSQSNFMLIIITHDEYFITALGKLKKYLTVSRNEETKSVVTEVVVA